MRLTESAVIRQFLSCEKRWLESLLALRSYHATQMGRATTNIQWVSGSELGRFSWLGYYWHREMFWFGYGLNEGAWKPLIEADNRSKYSGVLEELRDELSGTWESVATESNHYRRLWSPTQLAGNSDSELDWFRARSRELHEFVVQPGF